MPPSSPQHDLCHLHWNVRLFCSISRQSRTNDESKVAGSRRSLFSSPPNPRGGIHRQKEIANLIGWVVRLVSRLRYQELDILVGHASVLVSHPSLAARGWFLRWCWGSSPEMLREWVHCQRRQKLMGILPIRHSDGPLSWICSWSTPCFFIRRLAWVVYRSTTHSGVESTVGPQPRQTQLASSSFASATALEDLCTAGGSACSSGTIFAGRDLATREDASVHRHVSFIQARTILTYFRSMSRCPTER